MNLTAITLSISGLAYSGGVPPTMVDDLVQVAVTLRSTGDFAAARQALRTLQERLPARCISARRQLDGILSTIRLSTVKAAA